MTSENAALLPLSSTAPSRAEAPGVGRARADLAHHTLSLQMHTTNYADLVRLRGMKLDFRDGATGIYDYLSETPRNPYANHVDAYRQVNVQVRPTPFSSIGAGHVVTRRASPVKLVSMGTNRVTLQQLPRHDESLAALRALKAELDGLAVKPGDKVFLKSDGGKNLRVSANAPGMLRTLSGSAGHAWSLLATLGIRSDAGRRADITAERLGSMLDEGIAWQVARLDQDAVMKGDLLDRPMVDAEEWGVDDLLKVVESDMAPSRASVVSHRFAVALDAKDANEPPGDDDSSMWDDGEVEFPAGRAPWDDVSDGTPDEMFPAVSSPVRSEAKRVRVGNPDSEGMSDTDSSSDSAEDDPSGASDPMPVFTTLPLHNKVHSGR